MEEIWKYAFKQIYSVSNLGRVKSHRRYRGSEDRILIPGKTRGYLRVVFSHDGIKKNIMISDLVAAAFIGPKPKGFQVNHKDTNKANNVPNNLEYVTPKENIHHAFENGCCGSRNGEKNGSVKLTDKEVIEIRYLYSKGNISQVELAKRFSINRENVSLIVNRKSWKHI